MRLSRSLTTVTVILLSWMPSVHAELMQLTANGNSFLSDFSVVFDDTGDGLLQFEEIVSFSGATGVSPTGQQLTYTGIAYVPDIPGFATASGVLNPTAPCAECWELTPSNFGDLSDGWFVTRWTYTLSQSPGPNTFSSTVTFAFGPFAELFNIGDPVDITFLLDRTVTDSDSAPDAGVYPNATIQLVADFPATQLQMQFSGGTDQTFNNTPNPDDQIFIFGANNDTGAQLGGELIASLEMDFIGTTDMLSSDRLIAGIPPDIVVAVLFITTESGITQMNVAPPVRSAAVTAPADDCTVTAGGCNPTGLHEFTLPDGFVPPSGATITQTAFPFLDSRTDVNGRCDGQMLEVLFNGDLIIPGHLCGSPEFQVIVTETNFDIFEDTILNTVFPDQFVSNPIDCEVPIVGDPQLQSAFVWQPDNSAGVVEGTAIALTNDCGSSRGRVRGFSFVVVGLHIDFGLDFDADPAAVTQAFVDLTSTKLNTLVIALTNAQPALSASEFHTLTVLAELAERLHNKDKYQAANRILQVFLRKTERIQFDTSVEFNHEGNLLSRADHISFLLEEFIIPFAR